MKNANKFLALILALAMCFSMSTAVFAEEAGAALDFAAIDEMDYDEACETIYDYVLGDFAAAYDEAKEETGDMRMAKMAIAEAKLLESGVFLPIQTQGGHQAEEADHRKAPHQEIPSRILRRLFLRARRAGRPAAPAAEPLPELRTRHTHVQQIQTGRKDRHQGHMDPQKNGRDRA